MVGSYDPRKGSFVYDLELIAGYTAGKTIVYKSTSNMS